MPPGFSGFLTLTKLSLFNVGFPDGPRELEALIAASPLLEELWLLFIQVPDNNGEYLQWEIQAPKLRYLFIDQLLDYGWEISDLPSLEEADINVAMYNTYCDFVKLMTGLGSTKKLKFAIPVNCSPITPPPPHLPLSLFLCFYGVSTLVQACQRILFTIQPYYA